MNDVNFSGVHFSLLVYYSRNWINTTFLPHMHVGSLIDGPNLTQQRDYITTTLRKHITRLQGGISIYYTVSVIV